MERTAPAAPATSGENGFRVHLGARGAHFDPGIDARFAWVTFPGRDASDPSVHPLTADGLIRVSGADAESFLQGQLSNDVTELAAPQAQLTTWCTAQGRVLATMLAWREGDGYLLQLPGELVEAVLTRLRRYVLRARVILTDPGPAVTLIGIAGTGAAAALRGAMGDVSAKRMALTRPRPGTAVIALGPELFQIVVTDDSAPGLWDRLTADASPGSSVGWTWHLVQAGIPVITAATQDQFVPQMANLEQLGAISFSKGCYPGQEIVARAQYRGQVKRRLYRLHAERGAPRPGQKISAPGFAGDAGMVVNAAAAPSGGMDLLAVLQVEAAGRTDLQLAGEDGGPLVFGI